MPLSPAIEEEYKFFYAEMATAHCSLTRKDIEAEVNEWFKRYPLVVRPFKDFKAFIDSL